MTVQSALLASVAGLWFALALGATLIGARRARAAEAALLEARAVADLLSGAPALPVLVYPDGALDADPRIAAWFKLEAVPLRFTDLAGAPGAEASAFAALDADIAATRTTARPFARTLALDGERTMLNVRGGPYAVGVDRRAVLLWFLDVSEQQRESTDLRRREARMARALEALSSIIEAAPFPMWHRGPDLALALVNGAYVRAIDADSAEQVVAQGLELIEGGSEADGRSGAAEARERKQIVARTAPAIVSGERRVMRVTDVPIGDAGVAGYAVDVQELEEARADLRLFVRAQRDMLDRLSAGVAQFGADHGLVFYNRHFVRLFALEPEWLSDRPDFDRVLERMREAQRAPESRDFPGWRAGRRAWFSTTEPIEENWLLPGGTHLRVVAQPLPDRGLLLIFEDRTEHLQLASARDTLVRVRTATFDNLFEAIGVFAGDGRLHLWNTRFRDVWDLADEELAQHPRVDVLVQAIAPKLLDPSRAGVIRELVRIATVERQHRSGRISLIDGRHFEFAAVPLPDGNALFTLLDITASRGIEEALRDRNEALEEADKLKTAFVANMSYELRVPLTSIAGFAEMLATGYAGDLSEQARDYVEAILGAVSRLSSLMGDVLDVTQSAAGTLPMLMEPVDVAEFVRGAVELVREPAHAAGLTLATKIAEAGSVTVDRKRLGQALDHLLRNAIAYTPAGGNVLVRTRSAEGKAQIIISDTGPGIPQHKRERIFDRFRRGTMAGSIHLRESNAQDAAGIGLPLARQFVEAVGGTLELAPDAGTGLCATISLPAAPIDE